MHKYAKEKFLIHPDGRLAMRGGGSEEQPWRYEATPEWEVPGNLIWATDEGVEYQGFKPISSTTITESDFIAEADCAGLKHHENALRHFFNHLGGIIISDPEPTNAELINEAYATWDREPQNFTFGEYLDRLGWKAPEGGGNDE